MNYNKEYYKHCLDILKKKYKEYTGNDKKFNSLEEIHSAYFDYTSPYILNGKLI